jgi:DNA-binding FadR family transcriptional regulator
MAVYLEFVGATVDDLLRARVLLEPVAARVASQHLTEDGIDYLRGCLTREQANEGFEPTGRERLHVVLGNLCGNTALTLFVDVLVELTTSYARVPTLPADPKLQELKSESDHAHGAIVDAVVSGNHILAHHRTVRHLRAVHAWLMSAKQSPIDRGSSASAPLPPTAKLAETVADRLMTEIAASGIGAGEIFGSERELQARSDVSRAVFREAVRLLEHHHVARMRRGPHGGLVITDPNPAASVEAAVTYLRYQGASAHDLQHVREVIELGALSTVAARLHEPKLRGLLEVASDSFSETVSDDLPTLFVRLADNPILLLFTHILLAAESPDFEHSVMDRETRDAYAAVLAALLDGDSARAQHRLNRHLRRTHQS